MIDERFAFGFSAMSHSVDSNANEQSVVMPISKVCLEQWLNEGRLVKMSPLYPCGKPCSPGTHNEAMKKMTLFSAFDSRIMIERLL